MAKLKTGRHTGAMKAVRSSERRASRNRKVRKTIRTLAKALKVATEKKDAQAIREISGKFSSAWDKAAKRGVIHWKMAARKKSRLLRQANTVLAPKAAA